jgi:oligoendopeptidase F
MEKDRQVIQYAYRRFIDKWKGRNDYLSDVSILAEALEEYFALDYGRESGMYEAYFWFLSISLDTENSDYRAKQALFEEFLNGLYKEILFFTNKLSKISDDQQQLFLSDRSLSKYNVWLRNLFDTGRYRLSVREEQIMLLMGKTAHSNWVGLTERLIFKEEFNVVDELGNVHKATLSSASKYLKSQNDEVRYKAGHGVNNVLSKWGEVATDELNSVVWTKKVSDDLRGYKRADEASLLEGRIGTKFVDTLIEATTNNVDISHRFYKLKAKLLKKDTFVYTDRNIEACKVAIDVPFEVGWNLVVDAFESVDKSLGAIVQRILDDKTIDVYPKRGKEAGAFCTSTQAGIPVYVLLNYVDDLHSVTTLAHELGHAVNHTLTARTQPSWYNGHSMAVAETSSTFFESVLLENLLKKVESDKDVFAIKYQRVESFIQSVFRQIAFYQFELSLHNDIRRKGYLSSVEISDLFSNRLKEYLGPLFTITDEEKFGWVHISHFRKFFYVYSYASGLLIAQSMKRRLTDDKRFADQILYFLKQGTNLDPADLFNKLGINVYDVRFWNDGFHQVSADLKWLESNVDQFCN